ncbi:MAG: peptidase [Gammaproteobacteria bacterium]
MTYCLAINVNEGLVFCSDSRSSAGVDQISTYSKMFTFGTPGERQIVICNAGNLATTQTVIKAIEKDIRDAAKRNVLNLPSMDEIANYVGELNVARQAENTGGGPMYEASFLVGGQIVGHPPAIYMIYPQGNYITSSPDTPFLQIGETKYGKPILDRSIRPETSLQTATVCALLSMDSTIRSNLTVGPPVEVLAYSANSLNVDRRFRYEADDRDLRRLHSLWEQKLRDAVHSVPFNNWLFNWEPEMSQEQSSNPANQNQVPPTV